MEIRSQKMTFAPHEPAPEQSGLPGFTLPLDYLPEVRSLLYKLPTESTNIHRENLSHFVPMH